MDPRAPPGGDEQVVTAQLTAVPQGQDIVRAVAPRGGGVHAEEEFGAVAAQHLAERVAQRRGLAGQHVPGPLDQGHLAAQPPDRLGHLGADRPAAEDEQAARDGLHPVTSRLVQIPSSSRRPGTGGMTGSEPVATTTWLAV